MAQVSYGTITINDITDISDIYLQYCMVADNITANNIPENSWFVLSSDTTVQNKHYYIFNNSDNQYHIITVTGSENPASLGWYEDKPYPTWQSSNQIWIREARIKEGIDLPEYGTPYLDTAVNQINTSVINIDNRLKTFFYPGDTTRNFSGAFVTGKTEAEGLVKTNSNTYGFNTRVATGLISMGYNRLPLLEMGLLGNDFNGIKLYSPVVENSQIIDTIKGLELSDNGLNFYNTNGVVTSSFGNSISLASNGATITIGSTNSYNTYIDSQGLSLRNGITENAKLDSNGLVLSKGGIQAGSISAGNDGYIYLSTEDYPLETFTKTTDLVIDSSKDYYEYSSANSEYIQVTNPIVSDIGSYYEREGTGLTIGEHTPANMVEDVSNVDPAWRQIIGSKFGVDSEGNLYANDAHLSNANVEGAITATSLTINSGDSIYSGTAAINISGYLIEIVVDPTGVVDPEHTTYLYPILYHNGEKVVPRDYSHFLWYEEGFDTATAGDGSNLGRYLATYGHRYRVTYAFDDGAVEGGTITQTLQVDPQKYITKINDFGITIHPEDQSNNNFIQLDGTGLDIRKNNVSVANYGSSIRVGVADSKHLIIDSNGINILDNNISLANYGSSVRIGQVGAKYLIINSNGIDILDNQTSIANFGSSVRIGQNNSGHTILNSNGMEIFIDNNTSVASFENIIRIGQEENIHMNITSNSIEGITTEQKNMFTIDLSGGTFTNTYPFVQDMINYYTILDQNPNYTGGVIYGDDKLIFTSIDEIDLSNYVEPTSSGTFIPTTRINCGIYIQIEFNSTNVALSTDTSYPGNFNYTKTINNNKTQFNIYYPLYNNISDLDDKIISGEKTLLITNRYLWFTVDNTDFGELDITFWAVNQHCQMEVYCYLSAITNIGVKYCNFNYESKCQGSTLTLGTDELNRAAPSATIGTGLYANNAGQLSVGKYNSYNTNALFDIGNGGSSATRASIFTVRSDNSITIGLDTVIPYSGDTIHTNSNDSALLQSLQTLGWDGEIIQEIPFIHAGGLAPSNVYEL